MTILATTHSMHRYLFVILSVWTLVIVSLAAPRSAVARGTEGISANTTTLPAAYSTTGIPAKGINSTIDQGSGNITAIELGSDGPSWERNFPIRGWLSCETSWASPTFTEIDYLIDKVAKKPGWRDCTQKNRFGSKCTMLESYRGGAISFCGRYGRTLACSVVATAAQIVRDHCDEPEMQRAGGIFRFDGDANVWVVVH
jgi:hypothetical protein